MAVPTSRPLTCTSSRPRRNGVASGTGRSQAPGGPTGQRRPGVSDTKVNPRHNDDRIPPQTHGARPHGGYGAGGHQKGYTARTCAARAARHGRRRRERDRAGGPRRSRHRDVIARGGRGGLGKAARPRPKQRLPASSCSGNQVTTLSNLELKVAEVGSSDPERESSLIAASRWRARQDRDYVNQLVPNLGVVKAGAHVHRRGRTGLIEGTARSAAWTRLCATSRAAPRSPRGDLATRSRTARG